MLLLKRPFCVLELQDLVLQSCFKSKLLSGPAAEAESSHWPISPHQKHSARCCFLDKIYPYIRHTDGGSVDHLGSCHSQCSCLTPMFKPHDVPALDPSVWSQTKRKTKKSLYFLLETRSCPRPMTSLSQRLSSYHPGQSPAPAVWSPLFRSCCQQHKPAVCRTLGFATRHHLWRVREATG